MTDRLDPLRRADDSGLPAPARTIPITAEACLHHRQHKVPVHRYLINSRFMVIISSPIIWLCLLPIALADAIGTLYQAVCFPIYGIPKVRRRDYLMFDRHHLGYLNIIEKLNCEYCAYVNGILAYFTEIAARTEQHWCPIKHNGCAKCAHSRYRKFAEFGDARQYREQFPVISRAFQDLENKTSADKD